MSISLTRQTIRAKWLQLYINLGCIFCFLNIWGEKWKDKAVFKSRLFWHLHVSKPHLSAGGAEATLSSETNNEPNSLMNLVNNYIHSDPCPSFLRQHNSYFYWIQFNQASTFWVSTVSCYWAIFCKHVDPDNLYLQGPHNLVR